MLYPRTSRARTLLSLNGLWKFALAEDREQIEHWIEKGLDEAEAELVSVPASYNDQLVSQEARDHCGLALYERELLVPEAMKGQRLVLRFGSVTHNAEVYLNGTKILEHTGGFLPFEADIAPLLKEGKNRLQVVVDNRVNYGTLPIGNEVGAAFFGADLPDIPAVHQTKVKAHNAPNFDFFNYAGIHRPVTLYTTPNQYIEDIVLVPVHDENGWSVNYTVKTSPELPVQVDILDEAGHLVASAKETSGSLAIKEPQLWNPGTPYLYTARVRAGEDEYEEPFGLRTVKIEGTKFLINGKPFYFKGFGKHEDCESHGRGLDEVQNVHDLNLIRWIHANSFRTSHYPYSEEMMELCDRKGIVVIDETPAVGLNFGWNDPGWSKFRTHDHHKQVIQDMIARDKNHPCVVLWSIANEPDTEKQPEEARAYFEPLYQLAHACDPQDRPVSLVICQNDYTRDLTAPMMDIVLANRYYGWYVFAGDLEAARQAMEIEMQYWKSLNKPFMICEYGADTVAGIHNAVPNMFSEEYQVEYLKTINEVLDACDFVVGEHTWNFADFATIQGTLRVDGNKKGIFTRSRRPKMAAHALRARWEKIPDFGWKQPAA